MTTIIQQSLWRAEGAAQRRTGPLPNEVDVVVIGGGITGLTTALLLKQSGRRVAVFEREQIGSGETGSTSAHLTYATDLRIADLSKQFGRAAARLAWLGGKTAIDLIESNAERGMACWFQRVPGYVCAPFLGDIDIEKQRASLLDDATLASELGFAVQYVDVGPVTGRPAIALADQAIFHPLEYLEGLALAVDGDGSVVRESCEVGDVLSDPLAVIVNGETVVCQDLVIATHVPMVGIRGLAAATLFQTKLYPYSTYVLGAAIDDRSLMPGLYSDTADPYNYLRVHDWSGRRYAIFGGADHKTGQASSAEEHFQRVNDALSRLIPSAQVDRQWSGQVIETSDGLPYIGQVADHQYIATGYAGNGLTFGTLAGIMMRDAIVGDENPWRDLFDPHRKASTLDALKTLVSENVDYPFYFVADRLRGDNSGAENVPAGAGKVIVENGKRVAVHRTDSGEVIKVSAVCTHMGCLVRWNDAERTWDCPCHGSRFTPQGLVLGGPAEAPLERID